MSRRTIDIAFPARRLAVFVDGCFWHGCLEHARPSRSNLDFWSPKIERNRARDQETQQHLEHAGWTVVRVWEHEDTVESVERVVARIRDWGS